MLFMAYINFHMSVSQSVSQSASQLDGSQYKLHKFFMNIREKKKRKIKITATATTVIKLSLKYSPMSEGITCIADLNLGVTMCMIR